jgi:hypothetical protein
MINSVYIHTGGCIRYRPDLIWLYFGINFVLEQYKKQFLADYYNKETEWGKELAITYKGHDLVPGTGLIDKELEWSMTDKGLEIDVPDKKPCEDAFVFKITRKSPF